MKVFYPSLIQWCADIVVTAIAQSISSHPESMLMPGFKVEPQSFGLISSPIVLWLAAQQQESPANVGQRLIAQIQQMKYPYAPNVSLQANHWLYFEFLDAALAHWLQRCYESELIVEGSEYSSQQRSLPPVISENPDIFGLQYAHARCCSLLSLGAETRGISLSPQTAIPWLHDSQQLQFNDLAEKALIHQILQFPHLCSRSQQIAGFPYCLSPGERSQLSNEVNISRLQLLSEVFLLFYRDCRIFGTAQPLDWIKARLGLIYITHRLLAFALNHGLNHCAPMSL